MNKLTLPLLGALSSTETVEDNLLEQELNKIRKSINDEVLPRLRTSRFVAKSRLEQALERCLQDASILCILPQLLGHSCIGIVEGTMPLQGVLSVLGADSRGLAVNPLLLPLMLLPENTFPRIQALSLAGKIINLSELEDHPADLGEVFTNEEYETFLRLPEDGIHPRDVVSALLHFTPLERQNSTYILLPPEELRRAASSNFIAQSNVMIILGKVTNENLISLRNDFTMPVYIVSENASDVQEMAEYLKSRYAGRKVDIVSPENLKELIDSLDVPVQRITLHDRLLAELLQVEEYLSGRLERTQNLLKDFKRDSILGSQDIPLLNEMLETLQKDIRNELQSLEEEKKNFSDARSVVLEYTEKLEKSLQNLTPQGTSSDRLHAGTMRPEALWRRIILRSLVSGEMELAEKYQRKFESVYSEHAFLTSLYIRRKKQKKISRDEIDHLCNMPDSPETLRAKIYFRNELGLTEQDCINIVKLLPRRKNSEEKYYWAWHLYQVYKENQKTAASDTPAFEDVLEAFWAAALAGSTDASELLAKFYGGVDRPAEAQKIADMGNPTGAYIFRLLSAARGDSGTADRYLKIASALGHPQALAQYADKYWQNRLAGDNVQFNVDDHRFEGLHSSNYVNAMKMYESLLKHPVSKKIDNFKEKFGYFLFCNQQWQDSRNYISQNAKTPEGNFCLSIMLKHGLGGLADEKEAVRRIKIVEQQTESIASFAHVVKLMWLKKEISDKFK